LVSFRRRKYAAASADTGARTVKKGMQRRKEDNDGVLGTGCSYEWKKRK